MATQKMDKKDMEAHVQGIQCDLRHEQLRATEIPRYCLSRPDLEEFLDERFRKGKFYVDELQRVKFWLRFISVHRDKCDIEPATNVGCLQH
ncbi:uncharacterized protein FRV6_16625 [Fusarium oxysporum]|uniref:Uncharacterized protein n=1 Tax=Fusarium oxysporum TaxID=5507 RepID=A0A2H3TV70_FUSOX|nr:uncharacterized protein FRV6_16625 [Fusarium oxysporum]